MQNTKKMQLQPLPTKIGIFVVQKPNNTWLIPGCNEPNALTGLKSALLQCFFLNITQPGIYSWSLDYLNT